MFGAPQIPNATINLGNGKQFTMEAKDLSEENLYVEKIELNGQVIDSNFITYDAIMDGATLVFYMTDTP